MTWRPTVLATTTRTLVEEATAAHLDRAWLLAHAEISDAALADPEGRVPRAAHLALWAAIAHGLDRPDLGVHFAQSLRPAAFGPLGFLAMATDTVADALACIAAHHRLVKDSVTTRLVDLADGLLLEEVPAPGMPVWPAPVVDYALATYVFLLRQWTGEAVRPTIVFVPYSKRGDVEPLARAVGCEVRYDQPLAGLVFGDETLRMPLLTAQPGLRLLLASFAKQANDRLRSDARSGIIEDVRHALAGRLAEGKLHLSHVARDLRTSPRSLQRRLGAQGASFHGIVEEVRRSASLPLVACSRASIEEISQRLGYSETAAFRRAFKRWTGVAPSALRRERPI